MELVVVLYVLYFDSASLQEAVQSFGSLPFARPCIIPSQTVYLENLMYQEELLKHAQEWEDAHLVGGLSYRARQKGLGPDTITRGLSSAPKDTDVVVFMPLNVPMYAHAKKTPPMLRTGHKHPCNEWFIQTIPSLKRGVVVRRGGVK